MNQLKVGDVVFLNSENSVKMTVTEITEDGVECMYYHPETGKIMYTPTIPEEAFTPLKKLNDPYK